MFVHETFSVSLVLICQGIYTSLLTMAKVKSMLDRDARVEILDSLKLVAKLLLISVE